MEVGVRALKARLSSYLVRVERGEELTITSRGRPVARIVPVEEKPCRAPWIEQAAAEGWLTPAEGAGTMAGFLAAIESLPPVPPGTADAVLEELQEQRDSYYEDES